MIVAPDLLPAWLEGAAGLLMVALLALAARSAPWRGLLAAAERQHLLLGGTVGVLLLWLGTVELGAGVRIHLLAVTTLTLLLGWPLTLMAGAAAQAAQLLLLDAPPAALPVAWLLTVAVPATTTRLLVHALRRRGRRNLFLYLLGAGFGGGMASGMATAITALALLALAGQSALLETAFRSVPLLALVLFPEGFLNGMLVTAFTVFRPDLVKTFDERFYLDD